MPLAQAATQQNSDQHFQILLVVIAAGMAGIGWVVKRAIKNSDKRYSDLVDEMRATNHKLDRVAEGLANVVGQIAAWAHK